MPTFQNPAGSFVAAVQEEVVVVLWVADGVREWIMGWDERWPFCPSRKAILFCSCIFSITALIATQTTAFRWLPTTVSNVYLSQLWPQGDVLYTQYLFSHPTLLASPFL